MERKQPPEPSPRARNRPLPPQQRSRVSNGGLVRVGDGRSARSRRHRDLVQLYEGLVPERRLTPLTRSLCGRAAALSLAVEDQQAKIAANLDCDLDALVRAVGVLLRIERLLLPSRRRSAPLLAGASPGQELEDYVAALGGDLDPTTGTLADDPGSDEASVGDPGEPDPDDGDDPAAPDDAEYIPTEDDDDR